MSVRLLALDADGTLLDSRGVVRPRVVEVVRAAVAAGCQVVLATGRRLQSAAPIARRVGVSTLILTDGTVVFDLESNTAIYERVLDPVGQSHAVALIVDAGIQPILLESPGAGGMILTGPEAFDTPETASYLGPKTDVRRLPIDELARVNRIVTALALGDQRKVETLTRVATVGNCYSLVYWQPSTSGYSRHTLSFAPLETSMGHALAWLAAELGIAMTETMAVGDYDNDLNLIQVAGWGVAMGNAVESIKAVAQAVVADNENDGVAEAIEKWVLRPA